MATTFVVLDPAAGNSHADQVHEALERRADVLGSYELYETTGEEDIPALVRQKLQEGFDTFIAVGGDGTVSSVAAVLVGGDARLAIVPTGTGNVISHDTEIPDSLEESLDLIAPDAPVICIDAMQVNDTFAFLNISLGVSVGILRDAEPNSKRKLVHLAYIWSGLKNLAAVSVQPVRLWTDDEPHDLSVSEVLVANSPSIGLPDLSLPESRIDDGQVEVITFRTRHMLDYLGVILDVPLQRSRRRRNVQVFRFAPR